MRIRKVGVFSLGRILGTLYAALGLMIGAFFSVVALAGGLASQMGGETKMGGIVAVVMGVGAIVVFPLLYGLMGFLSGLLTALGYKLAAKVSGGLEIEIEPAPQAAASPSPSSS